MTAQEKLTKLFIKPETPFHAYPFDQIKDTDYGELIDCAIQLQREEIYAIESNTENPSFANTSLALENSGEALEALLGAFYNLLSANSNDILRSTAEAFSPKLSALSSDISLSDSLFQRIKVLHDSKETLSLSEEEQRLLHRQYQSFVRNGALLPKEKKEDLRKINEALNKASLAFGNNLLSDSKLFRLYLPPADEALQGIPNNILELAHQRAVKEGELSGYLFSLDAPEYQAIQRFAETSWLRETFYKAWMQRGYQHNIYNNAALVRKIVNLRLAKAQILGYPSYAHYALELKMVNHPDKVFHFIESLETVSLPKAEEELKKIVTIKGSSIKPWDINFYFEKLCQKDFKFSEKELKPYFPLESTIKGVLGLAERLYGLSFIYDPSLSVYAEGIKAYRVEDPERKEFIGLLYLDFFPREGKRSGAWMNNLREAREKQRPHILLVMNFNPPSEGQEALLLPSEVHTFLHEFGHALHGLLTQVRFSSLSGTNVVHDFVELPSQINENWLTEPEFLASFARHYQTGEQIPSTLLQRFIDSSKYRTGYDTQRQLAFGFLDLALHTINSPLKEDFSIEEFEKKAFNKAPGFGPLPEGCAMSPSFSHLFSGGYAAGYYGYKWSEVLSTDAFSLFQEHGVFDRSTAESFRKQILEKGDTDDPQNLYRAFRGRDPEIKALVKRDGFCQNQQ